MRWETDHFELLSGVIESARAGQPTVLVVRGEAGIGKSSLLAAAIANADGFVVRRVECLPYQAPQSFGTLAQLGLDTSTSDVVISAPLAAQRIRVALDEWSADGPVLVAIDDLQWADPESVEALLAVLARAEAERLLVVLATRPLGAADHVAFQRWERHAPNVHSVALDGLDRDSAEQVLRSVRPDISAELAEAVWRHAEGNPLYLRELAEEYDESQLAELPVLPAPTAYARAVNSRLRRLSPDAVSLAQAAAVLGDGWHSLPDIAAVAEVADGSVVDELLHARLLSARQGTGEAIALRFEHGLARSAVYLAIPPGARRALHLRAASIARGQQAVFEHRIAATLNYDDALADDLQRRADVLRAEGEYRSAARYLHFASTVTADSLKREQRWLDSLIDSVDNDDSAIVKAALPAVEDARDRRRRDLILARLAIRESRPHVAVRLLQPWSGRGPVDLCQYRIEGTLAWALVISDADDDQIRLALERTSTLPFNDTVVSRLVLIARGQLATRRTDDVAATATLAALPDEPQAVPLAATAALAWRGIMAAGLGHFRRSTLDLTEVTARMQAGTMGFSAGTYHAILARTQWFSGDWARARVNFAASVELSDQTSHLIVTAALPLQAIGEGDLARAREQITEARERLEQARWREAVDQSTIVEVAFAHAHAAVPADVLAQLTPVLDDAVEQAPAKSVMWIVHVALAAVWANRPDTAVELADALQRRPRAAVWTAGAVEWIRGLSVETRRNVPAALEHLKNAVQSDLSAVPLYQAHVLYDHARISVLAGDRNSAQASIDRAAEIYRPLTAAAYLDRVEALRPKQAERPSRPPVGLSERERDVLTLVIAGMSYAQIARDLFITQRTVGYHLGNIYDKSGVRSRHDLVELVRSDPVPFGLSI